MNEAQRSSVVANGFEDADRRLGYLGYYYGPTPPTEPHDGADVCDARVLRAADLRALALIGGDQEDILNTTILWSSLKSGCEFTPSQTLKVWHALISDGGNSSNNRTPVREDLNKRVRSLVDRSSSLLRGAALFAFLRCMSLFLARYDPGNQYRRDISESAGTVLSSFGVRAGHSAVSADDAHAHLRWASLVHVDPDDQDMRRTRSFVAQQGIFLLYRSILQAWFEPWCPFTLYRLAHELVEHDAQFDLIPDASDVRAELNAALEEIRAATAKPDAEFARWLPGRSDLDVFCLLGLNFDRPPAELVDPPILASVKTKLRGLENARTLL